ncbi:alkaline phosphatase D family protein [Lutimonas zeaxanthinifaciens]|uniref:alkaline phosphatase D family protein n=1 Tax=Lutimonas zeaxanthinifaciens TaxID=3060215 RepID=UPI00265CB1C6|nr:alkaline phosphatase D family protein [Lutimonas sp. YSD2104]WKK64789.1 alkaline phosphatase D family protein [Lutimonas sp. YSD2104]
MRNIPFILVILLISVVSCKKDKKFVLSFGSCNNQNLPNPLWEPLLENKPDVFIWGGDIIYSDTYDMNVMKRNYDRLKNDSSYIFFREQMEIMGVWDDHDYGLNDGGVHYSKKDSAQLLFLDFFDVDVKSYRRKQQGIYHSRVFKTGRSSIKIILLDTRYFRSDLEKDPSGKKRYIPTRNTESTMLGEKQWAWLQEELENSTSQFNVIVSSIQFLSREHGFETWGNMPLEVERMMNLIKTSKASGVIFLSGDRHIAEISKTYIENSEIELVDVTSSGMTHSYESFTSEPNPYRVGEVISEKNFGVLIFDLKNNQVDIEIRGEENILFERYVVNY